MRVLIVGPEYHWTEQSLNRLKQKIQKSLPVADALTLLYRGEAGGAYVAVELYLDKHCEALELWLPEGFRNLGFGDAQLNEQHIEFSNLTARDSRLRISSAITQGAEVVERPFRSLEYDHAIVLFTGRSVEQQIRLLVPSHHPQTLVSLDTLDEEDPKSLKQSARIMRAWLKPQPKPLKKSRLQVVL